MTALLRTASPLVLLLAALGACEGPTIVDGFTEPEPAPEPEPEGPFGDGTPLGLSITGDQTLHVEAWAPHAERIEVEFFLTARDTAAVTTLVLTPREGGERHSGDVNLSALAADDIAPPFLYGFRVFGPNWPYDSAWTPGSETGFLTDVDELGNRFNPNKLLIDPYARELSHDPLDAEHDWTHYSSGPDYRAIDTAPFAPKSVFIDEEDLFADSPPRLLTRPLKDDVVYEVHLKGLTQTHPDIDANKRGTYAGAAQLAPELAELGITAIEFLPLHEAPNDQNDIDPESAAGDNYWGYNTLNFFSPERRYAQDKSLGGPTREFHDMVRAFADEGIKVFMDVVYNHTAENPPWGDNLENAPIISLRGLDNRTYYQLAENPAAYANHNGVSANLSAVNEAPRQLVIDSLQYWHRVHGVSGYRVDLAALHGNGCERDCFNWSGGADDGILVRAATELPARDALGGDGVDLLAEPWGAADGTYQLGNFPEGWAQWNDKFRDTFRSDINQLFVEDITPGALATRFAGSSDVMGASGPAFGINFITAHDGFTLRDLVSCTAKDNNQPWPYGPSDGGSDYNRSWDHNGVVPLQKQAARTLMASTFLSAGTPMILGGDERWRTTRCNNNTYNIDSEASYLDYDETDSDALDMRRYVQDLIAFRKRFSTLARTAFYGGDDADENDLDDISWVHDSGTALWPEYFDDLNMHFLAYRVDVEENGPGRSLYVGYNGWEGEVTATMPPAAPDHDWWLLIDTSIARQGDYVLLDPEAIGGAQTVGPRSLIVAVESNGPPAF